MILSRIRDVRKGLKVELLFHVSNTLTTNDTTMSKNEPYVHLNSYVQEMSKSLMGQSPPNSQEGNHITTKKKS